MYLNWKWHNQHISHSFFVKNITPIFYVYTAILWYWYMHNTCNTWIYRAALIILFNITPPQKCGYFVCHSFGLNLYKWADVVNSILQTRPDFMLIVMSLSTDSKTARLSITAIMSFTLKLLWSIITEQTSSDTFKQTHTSYKSITTKTWNATQENYQIRPPSVQSDLCTGNTCFQKQKII